MALVPTLSVAENVMLNDMVMSAKGKPLMNWAQLRTDAKRVLEKLHIDVNVRTLVQDLSLAQKQMVLIARAIANECNFLILDEPTAPLSDTETAGSSGWSSTFRKPRISPSSSFPTESMKFSRSAEIYRHAQRRDRGYLPGDQRDHLA